MKYPRRLPHVLLVLLAITCSAVAEKVSTLPAPSGYIDDYARVLSGPAKTDMESIARELHTKTRAQVFLVTINTLEGEPAEKFANELFAKWKIGEKKTDRGVLMLFAIRDHKRWIEIGYGLEDILNDAKVGDIGRDMVPALRAQHYDEATKLGLTEITRVIAADSNVTLDTLADSTQTADQNETASPPQPVEAATPSSALSGGKWILAAFPILWFILIFGVIIWNIRRGLRRGTGLGTSGGGSTWSDSSSFGDSSSSSSSGDSFSGGDGGSSGGGGAGGDW